jgi:hypothetical protein
MNRDAGRGGRGDDRDRWPDERRAPSGDVWDPYPADYLDPNSPGYRDPRPRRRHAAGDEDLEEEGRFTAPRIAMGIAVIGSLVFLVVAMAAGNLPLLATAAGIVGIVFVALAVMGGRGTWHAAVDGEHGRALALAVGGGVSAIIGLLSVAVAIVLVLTWGR